RLEFSHSQPSTHPVSTFPPARAEGPAFPGKIPGQKLSRELAPGRLGGAARFRERPFVQSRGGLGSKNPEGLLATSKAQSGCRSKRCSMGLGPVGRRRGPSTLP